MEGATDAEATAIARQTAGSCQITSLDPDPGVPGLALADATGTLTVDRIEAALTSGHPYMRSLGRFGRTVTMRYRELLAELERDPGEAHGQFIAAMISGDLAPLEAARAFAYQRYRHTMTYRTRS